MVPTLQALGFAEELFKIAEELKYRRAAGVDIAKGIPVVRMMPKNPEYVQKRLEMLTKPSDTAQKVLGYSNIAVPAKLLPDLEELGFKKTRIATPLPGEKALSPSWRKGTLHAHRIGPVYLMHQDKTDPLSGKLGYLSPSGIKHGVTEGIPSIVKRLKEKQSLVREHAARGLRRAADRVEE